MSLATPALIEMRPSATAPLAWRHRPLAAIRIGIDEVALKIVRPIVTGGTEVIHLERAPLGWDEDGARDRALEPDPTGKLIEVLRRYGRTCRGHAAIPRFVAGSAFCGLAGATDLIARAQREAEIEIETLSSRQESRLLCRGALKGRPASERALLVTTDGTTCSLVFAAGDQPVALWTLGLDQARVREIATASAADGTDATELRREAQRMVSEARLGVIPGMVGHVILVSDAARLAWSDGRPAKTRWLSRTLFRGLIVEALIEHLGLSGVRASQASLLDGVFADMGWAESREGRAPS